MVFKWPSMESVLEETVANTTVKDLDFRWRIYVFHSLWKKAMLLADTATSSRK